MSDAETLFNIRKDRVRFSGSHEAIFDYFGNERYTYKDLDVRSDIKGFLDMKKAPTVFRMW